MKKIINWFTQINPHIKGAVIGALIMGSFSIIPHLFLNADQQKPPDPHKQDPGVERINNKVFEYIKQIDKQTETNKKEFLINSAFEELEKSIELDQHDGETCFLYAEIYFRNKDYDNALFYYDKARKNKYFYEGNINAGYGITHEALGDQFISDNIINNAVVEYITSKEYLSKAMDSPELLNRDINEIKTHLAQVEAKKYKYDLVTKYDRTYFEIIRGDININSINQMIELANKYANLELWKNAVHCYYWLFNQNTHGQFKARIKQDFQFFSSHWEYSHEDNFRYDISTNSVRAIINRENVSIRQEPEIDDKDENIINVLGLHDKLQILGRSDFRQSIGNVRTYWYKVSTDDGIEGWVYGQFLIFYPIFSYE